jgi:hypothetical protein
MSTPLFPLLGSFSRSSSRPVSRMSHGEDWSPGYFVGVLIFAAMIGAAFARAGAAAWLRPF